MRDDTMRSDGFKQRIPVALVYLLMFQNLFNAGSPFATLALNLGVATVVLIQSRGCCRIPDRMVLFGTYAVLMWLFLVIIYRGGVETQIFQKYVRITLTISLVTIVFGSGMVEPRTIIKAINLSLGFHVALVLLQIVFPDITYTTAVIFGFDRDLAILDNYALRKLGASSSYDTASLLSVLALTFFYLQFHQSHRKSLLLMMVLSFIATLMSSRMGIAFSMSIIALISIRGLLNARMWGKGVIVIGASCFYVFSYLYVYPIFAHSLGISDLTSRDTGLIFSPADYGTTGTLEALTGEFLEPLNQPLGDLLIGFGLDPNSISRFSDIGYVKMIYHVGIIGTVLIMLSHTYMCVMLMRRGRWTKRGAELSTIRQFLFIVLLLGIAFNYKSLELYSRGVGDFIFIVFLFLASTRRTVESNRIPVPLRALTTRQCPE